MLLLVEDLDGRCTQQWAESLSASRVQPSLMQVYLCFVLELLPDGLEPLPETMELLLVGLCTQQ